MSPLWQLWQSEKTISFLIKSHRQVLHGLSNSLKVRVKKSVAARHIERDFSMSSILSRDLRKAGTVMKGRKGSPALPQLTVGKKTFYGVDVPDGFFAILRSNPQSVETPPYTLMFLQLLRQDQNFS